MHGGLWGVVGDELLKPVHDLLLVGAGWHGGAAGEGLHRAVHVVTVTGVALLALHREVRLFVLVDKHPLVDTTAVRQVVTSLPAPLPTCAVRASATLLVPGTLHHGPITGGFVEDRGAAAF